MRLNPLVVQVILSVELLLFVPVLLVTVITGIVVHELSHACVLRLLGMPYDIEWGPTSGQRRSQGIPSLSAWATVTPQGPSCELSAWGVRCAAIAPLALSVPIVLIASGAIPVSVDTSNAVVAAAVVGWLACALPSPQDFSVFWYAHDALEREG